MCAALGRFGSMAAPIITQSTKELEINPMLIFGGISIIGLIHTIPLKETLNEKLKF